MITGAEQSTSDLVTRALCHTRTAYRPSIMPAQCTHLRIYLSFVIYLGITPEITIQTVLSFLDFLHCNSVKSRVISNYVSSLKTAAHRYKWDSEPLYHQLVSAYLRSITINSTFNPTRRGTFDLNTLTRISIACEVLQDLVLYRAIFFYLFLCLSTYVKCCPTF